MQSHFVRHPRRRPRPRPGRLGQQLRLLPCTQNPGAWLKPRPTGAWQAAGSSSSRLTRPSTSSTTTTRSASTPSSPSSTASIGHLRRDAQAVRRRRVGDRRYLVRLSTEDGHQAVHAIFDDCDSVAREMLTGVGVGFVTFKPASAPICANYAFYQMRPPRAARCRRPHLFRGDAQTKTHLNEADRTDLLGTRVVWPVV